MMRILFVCVMSNVVRLTEVQLGCRVPRRRRMPVNEELNTR